MRTPLFAVIFLSLALIIFPHKAQGTVCGATGYVAINKESKKCYQGLRDWCVENEPKPNKGWKIYEGEKDDKVTTDTFTTPFGTCVNPVYAEPKERTCCQLLNLTNVDQAEAVTVKRLQNRSEQIKVLIIFTGTVIAILLGILTFFVIGKKNKK